MIRYVIKYYLNTISPKGRIAWEYNPLHNFRRTKDTDKNGLHSNLVKLYGQLFTLISQETKYETENGTPKLYTYKRYKDINGNTLVIKYLNNNNVLTLSKVYLKGEEIDNHPIIFYDSTDIIEAGSIVDFDTELLNFSLNNPVQIDVLPSYDGSVNLILNDKRNPPRLINSRFSKRQLNTYEIVDRIGDNDTNIYDDDVNQFDLDTSLYKKYNKIPRVTFNKVISGGNLKVGNYVFYFRYCDADENETDFVAESGIIPIFKGNDKDPFSIDGGFVDMNAHKSIDITLTNIDEAYDYIKVYYSRTSSDFDLNRQVTAHRLIKKFIVSRNTSKIIITGDEQEELIPSTDLVSEYFIAESVKTQALCLNRLFLGNVSRPDPLHQDLSDLSIRMLPYYNKTLAENLIGKVDSSTYSDNNALENNYEYYNTKNIYYNLGYWNEEIYRIGVVYIMYDNTLSKVYNIRGCDKLPLLSELQNNNLTDYYTNTEPILDDEGNREYIKISEDDFSIIGGKYLENSRGVVRFFDNSNTQEYVYSLGVIIPEEVYLYLKNYCGVKGLFFVRQKRIPTIMAQGITIPIDPESRVPLIYYVDGTNERFGQEGFVSQEKIKTQHKTLLRHSKYRQRELVLDYDKRVMIIGDEIGEQTNVNSTNDLSTSLSKILNSSCAAIICPEYEIRQQYYNQFFTGTEYPIGYIDGSYTILLDSINERFYVINGNIPSITQRSDSAKLVSVTEEVPTVAIGDKIFRGVCGTAQEAFRFKYAFKEGSKTKDDVNLLRGIWHPYIGAVFKNKVDYGKIVNIYIPGYNISELANYYKVRYSDNSPYYPIGNRIGINDITSNPFNSSTGYLLEFFRGDCYICTFTHRLNRNFNDPAAPANDEIVDKDSWAEFDPEDETTFEKINLGDVNAIKIGSWYTFRVRSNTNLSIRSLDESHLEEKGIFGLPRGFYPLSQELENGDNKIPDSYNVNDGFRSNFGEKFYMRYPDVPYVKNNFENRILYSDIAVNDAFRNGYRVFKSTNFNDYTKEYGSIVKLITMSSEGLLNGLLCVFEHGIAYIPVNERSVAGGGAGGNVFINTSNILPDNPRILSDKFGSQWLDSIILTPYFVYGVDTVAKKIWRTNGGLIEVISDFKVNKFLIDNITLSEKELTPIIGVRNVKTHYNANKNDVMFTFYDNQYGIEEKVWNLCYNEINQKFITFYSWVPSYSENIDNIYFSFDRETSKAIAKLGTSQVGSTNADGIVLTTSVIEPDDTTNLSGGILTSILTHWNEAKPSCESDYDQVVLPTIKTSLVGLENRIIPSGDVIITYTYSIEKDPYGNWRNFIVYNNQDLYFCPPPYLSTAPRQFFNSKKVWYVYIKCEIRVTENDASDYAAYAKRWDNADLRYNYGYYTSVIAITSKDVWDNYVKYEYDNDGHYRQVKATDVSYEQDNTNGTYYLDGDKYITPVPNNYSGNKYKRIISKSSTETLTTDFWKHGQAGIIDIKDQIEPCLWYGKLHPFEFEFVVRDVPNMHKVFDNLEIISNKAEPESFHFEVVGEGYEFHNDKRNMYVRQERTKEMWQKLGINTTYDRKYNEITPERNIKSTIFPLYYNRIDTYDNIYDYYTKMKGDNRDYRNLSGSEIVRDKQLNEYRVLTHIKNTPITKNWNEVPYNQWAKYPIKYTKVKYNGEIITSEEWLNKFITIRGLSKTIQQWFNDNNLVNKSSLYPTNYYVFKDTGRIRGNSHYKEDRWKILIPSITFMLKNEQSWITNEEGDIVPPIVVNYIPEEYPCSYINNDILPNIYNNGQTIFQKYNEEDENYTIDKNLDLNYWIDINPWTYRKETKIRDKYLKVRIRYEGSLLAVIQAVLTTYTESYA